MSDRRFPRSVFSRGTEPDARFTLANERTFLAWIRTALALIAGGVALEVLGLDLHAGLRLAASLVLVAVGVLTPALAWFGWMRTELALREGRPLPTSPLGVILGSSVTLAGLLVILAILLR
ncbi:YidH family protein [Microbacterium sp. NPDC056044]|uniref:YidH family protein n=1 Tax=Microbacterium sp. NPDC056044 TaxID=3345690 RepID=UPI0035D57636